MTHFTECNVGVVLPGGVTLEEKERSALRDWLDWQVAQGSDPDAVRSMLAGDFHGVAKDLAPVIAEATGAAEVLEQPIRDLRSTLATGEHDANLAELLEAERVNRCRKGAIRALEERRHLVRLDGILAHSIPDLELLLAAGLHDDDVGALCDREACTHGRKGALAALEARLRLVRVSRVLEGTLADLDVWLKSGPPPDEVRHLLREERSGKARIGALTALGHAAA